MNNKAKSNSQHSGRGSSAPRSSHEESVESRSFEDGCKVLEAVTLEVAVADQQIIDLICKRLLQENELFESRIIEGVCKILGKLNHSPSVDLLKETLNCLKEGGNDGTKD